LLLWLHILNNLTGLFFVGCFCCCLFANFHKVNREPFTTMPTTADRTWIYVH
jgi:hypothetical protein